MATQAQKAVQAVHERSNSNVRFLDHLGEMCRMGSANRIKVSLGLDFIHQNSVRCLHNVHLEVYLDIFDVEEHAPVQGAEGAKPHVVSRREASVLAVHEDRPSELELHLSASSGPQETEKSVV